MMPWNENKNRIQATEFARIQIGHMRTTPTRNGHAAIRPWLLCLSEQPAVLVHAKLYRRNNGSTPSQRCETTENSHDVRGIGLHRYFYFD
jgi:hypothetical protein